MNPAVSLAARKRRINTRIGVLFTGLLALLPVSPALVAQSGPEAVRRPPEWPTPEEYLRNRDGQGVAEAPAAARREPTPADRRQAPTAPEDGFPAAMLPPHTVQVAAFREYRSAQRFLDQAGMPALSILRATREGAVWHVVVLGLFDTREAAAAAEAAYRRERPGAATWLRGTTLLERQRHPPE